MSDILSQDEINSLLSSMGDDDLGGGEEFDTTPEPIVASPIPKVKSQQSSGFNISGMKDENISNLFDIKIQLIVIYGRKQLDITSIIGLKAGTVLGLDKLKNEPVEINVNGSYIAVGELNVVDGMYAVRLSNLVSPETRLKTLRTK